MPIDGWRVLTPPIVDWHTVEGTSFRLDLIEAPLPPIIFGGAEIEPVSTPSKQATAAWTYGDVCTVYLRKLEEESRLHLRVQSMALALWTSHAEWLEAVRQIAEALEVTGLRTTRLDICVDVEGLDVTHDLVDYCVGHRGKDGGGVRFDGKGGGRQIEIGERRSAKRFVRIYLKSAMDCSTYMPTWRRQGFTDGRVVRVEVEFKNAGLPSRDPAWYLDTAHVAALYGDAVKRYRVVETPENRRGKDTRKVGRRSRAKTHAAWAALCTGAVKWMVPPDPVWTTRQRLDAARVRVSRGLGALAARMGHRHAEMDDLDSALAALRAMGPGAETSDPEAGVDVHGPPRNTGLIEEDFLRAREQTEKREALLAGLARARYGDSGERDPWVATVGQTPPRQQQGAAPGIWTCCGGAAWPTEPWCPECGRPEKPKPKPAPDDS